MAFLHGFAALTQTCPEDDLRWDNGGSRHQFGPEGPEVSTSAACRSPAVRDQAKGRRAAGDPNLKLEAPHGTDSSQTPRWREPDSNHRSRSCEGSSGRCQSEAAARRWTHLQVQVRDGDACLEWHPIGFPFAVGPRVRIRLPPQGVRLRRVPRTLPVKVAAVAPVWSCFGTSEVIGQVLAVNPAHAVRGPKHVVRRGKTPVLTEDQARRLLESIDT